VTSRISAALFLGASLYSLMTPAFAQQSGVAQEEEASPEIKDIVVTG
jgi:hypothetical protein